MCDSIPHDSLGRRSFLHAGACAAASLVTLPALARPRPSSGPLEPLDIALRAERWIHSHRIETQHGVSWPWNPQAPEVVTNLYTGTPGIALFYLELFHATGEQAFLDEGAIQCGYCTPGMIMATKVLLDKNPRPTEYEARKAIEGNLCRCGAYQNIIEATISASRKIDRETGAM